MSQISIIIPVYKVEEYLRRCLDSVLQQIFIDYECILVDDASPDNCPAICDEYAKKDPRFKVIHKLKNEGLPKARKSGLDIAVSDFIMHVDSDDWIEPDAIELLFKKQKETNANIIIGNFQEIYQNSIKQMLYRPIQNYENIVEWLIICEHQFLWGKLYRRTLFNNYIVPTTNILEDFIVNIQLFLLLTNDKIQFIDEVIYNYSKYNNSSLIQEMIKKKYNSYIEYPIVQSLLWVNDYLCKTMHIYDNKTHSAFNYTFLKDGVIPYLKRDGKIKKNEIIFIYANYYKYCSHIKLFKFPSRIIIPLYRFSIIIGNIYMFIYKVFLKTREYISRVNK
jgi:glycosyltransferase involved in cell wall biosynthesis